MKIGLFSNSSQVIGSGGLKLSRFDAGHPEVVMRKFGKDLKLCPLGYFFPKFSWLWSQFYP